MMEFGIVMEPSPGNTAALAEKIEGLGVRYPLESRHTEPVSRPDWAT